MNKVSVIVPVYNVEKYLPRCLDCIVGQTLKEIEIICVDDGSTDRSGSILDDYAKRDGRIRVIHQANAGAGAARNAGMSRATGEYLYFADADDFVKPRMLEKMSACADRYAAEIVVCGRTLCNAADGCVCKVQGLRAGLWLRKMPFAATDIADDIFTFGKNVAWDKLFRRDFVIGLGIRFQDLPRSNDVYFVNVALASAQRIALAWGAWVCHRQGRADGLQFTKDRSPDCIYQAFDALRAKLEAMGVFEMFKRSYAEGLLGSGLYNVNTLRERENVQESYRKLRERVVAVNVDFGSSRRFCRARCWQKAVMDSVRADGLPSPDGGAHGRMAHFVNVLPFSLREGLKILRYILMERN